MNQLKQIIMIVFLVVFIIPFQADAEDIIKKDESLSLERCIEIALKRQPAIIASMSEADASRSRIGEAQANYYPQIDLIASAARVSVGPRTSFGFETSSVIYNSYSTGATLNQTIYDFGRTASQVKVQELNYDSSISALENVSQQIVFNVNEAYYRVVQAKYSKTVAEDNVKQAQQHLEQAQGFFEAGTRPKFDVTKAEVDLSNAKLNLIRADNNLKISIVNLSNSMGVTDAPEYSIEENLSFEKYEITFENALSHAYENRPDLKSIIIQKQAAASSIELAKKDYYPVLAGTAGYDYAGNDFPLKKGWNIGATLTFPIFSGFLTKYQVEAANANLNVLKANEESLRQLIFLEIKQAYLTLRAAEDAIPTAKLGVEQAKENLDIANGRYTAGVGNPIEVTDAEVGLTDARNAHIQTLYVYKVAEASLKRAMGFK
jgi:outer membrane protein